MLHYRLSNRQCKELLVRSRRLWIAIPAPVDEESDWLVFAKLSLPDHAELIKSAELDWIWVTRGPIADDEPDLTKLLGKINRSYPRAENPKLIPLCCEVVVAYLEPAKRSREADLPLQWPGSLLE